MKHMKQFFFIIIALVAMLVCATSTSLAKVTSSVAEPEWIGTQLSDSQPEWVEPYVLQLNNEQAEYIQVFAENQAAQTLFGRFWSKNVQSNSANTANNAEQTEQFVYAGFGWVHQDETQIIVQSTVGTPVTLGNSQENMSTVRVVPQVLPTLPDSLACNLAQTQAEPFLVDTKFGNNWVVDAIIDCNMFVRNYAGTSFWVIRDGEIFAGTNQGFYLVEIASESTDNNLFGWMYPRETTIGDGSCQDLSEAICVHISDAMGTLETDAYSSVISIDVYYENASLVVPPMSVYTPEACNMEQTQFGFPEGYAQGFTGNFIGEVGCQNVLMWKPNGETTYQMARYWGTLPIPPESELYMLVTFAPGTNTGSMHTIIMDYLITHEFHGAINVTGIPDFHPLTSF